MKATLSVWRRDTATSSWPVTHGGMTPILAGRGQDCEEVILIPGIDRETWTALMETGPVTIGPRK
jgi:hypothetical protein